MIRRYSVKEISDIFSDGNKYKIWLNIELLVLEYLVHNKVITPEDYRQIKDDVVIIPYKIRESEKICNHDVVSFINCIANTTDSRARKWIHYGLTSSDLVDTGNSVMLRQANKVLFRKVEILLSRLKRIAKTHKRNYCVDKRKGFEIDGATSFGYKFASCYEEINQTLKELEKNRRHVECASISGSMGIFSHMGMGLQDFVAKGLGLYSADCSTQVLSRDRYYRYFSLINRILQSIGRLCIELRLLARTEIGEVSEAFHSGQMGSSSMPHKRNPVTLENICGLCRLFDSYCSSTSKNIPIWFERDISHSSVDRVVFLDGISIAVQAIQRFQRVLDGLRIYSDAMQKHIDSNQYLVFRKYISKVIYRKHADGKTMDEINRRLEKMNRDAVTDGLSFREVFEKSEWGKLSEELFDLSNHLGSIEDFYDRVFCDDYKKVCFDNVFYDEDEIVNSVIAIANALNIRYAKRKGAVRMVALKDEAVVFLSRLLPKLNFPVELHTVDVTQAEYKLQSGRSVSPSDLEIYRDHVSGNEVVLLGALFRNRELVDVLKSRIRKLGAKDVYCVSLFTKRGEGADLYGLKIPVLDGIAGFGLANSEGNFRNCGFIGKLKINFF